jgi:hypothetical protein
MKARPFRNAPAVGTGAVRKTHPAEIDLALFAGGESSGLMRFFLNRHVRQCRECLEQVTRFELLRLELRELEPPALDWNRLSAEMRANIHLGLEAGECVRAATAGRSWNPKLAVALASLLLLAGANFLLKNSPSNAEAQSKDTAAVLESTGSGVELRHGESSLTLLNRNGVAASQTVSAQGVIGASYIQAGAVTMTNVYLDLE